MKPAENVKKYFSRISSESIVGLLHHTDPDGVTSGVLAARLLERTTGQRICLRINQRSNEIPIKEETIMRFREASVSHVIITDLNVDEDMDSLQKLSSFCEVLILDHHTLIAKNTDRLTVFKPQMFSEISPSRYCASKIVYDLSEWMEADLEDCDWIAAIGLIGDIGTSAFPSFINNVFEKYEISLKENLFDTELGLCAKYISAAEAYDWRKAGEAYEIVYSAKSYEDILKSRLKEYYNIIQDDILKNIQNIMKSPAEDGIIYGTIKSRYSIKSKIGTIVSLQRRDKTIILAQEQGDEMVLSFRRGDGKIDMSKMVHECIKGLRGTGGGHMSAAGATISKKDFPEFLKRIREHHKKYG